MKQKASVGRAMINLFVGNFVFSTFILTSCSADSPLHMEAQQEQSVPLSVGFALTEMPPATRAANSVVSVGTIAGGGGFGVFAINTGLHHYTDMTVTSDFMYNQHVISGDGGTTWTYDPVKYWPTGKDNGTGETAPYYVSFFAYAPYSDLSGGTAASQCVTAFSEQYEQGNPWLTYRLHTDPSEQVDLLYAVNMDCQRPADRSKLSMQFRHALCCVGDEVSVSLGAAMQSAIDTKVNGIVTQAAVRLTSVSIRYTLTEKARLVLWTADGTPNWQPINSGSTTTERTLTYSDGLPQTIYSTNGTVTTATPWRQEGDGLFVIPLETDAVPQKATITIGYDILTTTGGGTTTDSKTTTGELLLGPLLQGGKNVAVDIKIGEL